MVTGSRVDVRQLRDNDSARVDRATGYGQRRRRRGRAATAHGRAVMHGAGQSQQASASGRQRGSSAGTGCNGLSSAYDGLAAHGDGGRLGYGQVGVRACTVNGARVTAYVDGRLRSARWSTALASARQAAGHGQVMVGRAVQLGRRRSVTVGMSQAGRRKTGQGNQRRQRKYGRRRILRLCQQCKCGGGGSGGGRLALGGGGGQIHGGCLLRRARHARRRTAVGARLATAYGDDGSGRSATGSMYGYDNALCRSVPPSDLVTTTTGQLRAECSCRQRGLRQLASAAGQQCQASSKTRLRLLQQLWRVQLRAPARTVGSVHVMCRYGTVGGSGHARLRRRAAGQLTAARIRHGAGALDSNVGSVSNDGGGGGWRRSGYSYGWSAHAGALTTAAYGKATIRRARGVDERAADVGVSTACKRRRTTASRRLTALTGARRARSAYGRRNGRRQLYYVTMFTTAGVTSNGKRARTTIRVGRTAGRTMARWRLGYDGVQMQRRRRHQHGARARPVSGGSIRCSTING